MKHRPAPHIVVYQSRHCPACRQLSAELIRLSRRLDAAADIRDVLEHLEAAARLGISQPPAVVIDGHLFGQGAAALNKLRRRLAT